MSLLSSLFTHVALLAQGTPGSQEPPTLIKLFGSPFFLLIIMMVVLFLFMSRSRRKEENARQEMLNQLKRGDRVETIGGILATVLEARETEVVLKVDESNNTKIHFSRSAIRRVIAEDKAPAK